MRVVRGTAACMGQRPNDPIGKYITRFVMDVSGRDSKFTPGTVAASLGRKGGLPRRCSDVDIARCIEGAVGEEL